MADAEDGRVDNAALEVGMSDIAVKRRHQTPL
jgi:hypothetical protein